MKKITFTKMILFVGCFFVFLSASAQTNTAVTGAWNAPGTWSLGIIPTSSHDVVIPTGVTVTIPPSYVAEANSLTLGATGTQLRLNEQSSLTVTGDIAIERSNDAIMFEYSSQTDTALPRDPGTLIFGGTITALKTIYVRRRLPSNNDWHLISTVGYNTRTNTIANTPNTTYQTSKIVRNTEKSIYSIASYNGANDAGSKYVYLPLSTSVANSNYFAKSGYSIKVNNTLESLQPDIFLRSHPYATDVSENISDAGDGFNLIGNPFTAYLHANTAADATNNLLSINSGVLEEQTIWLWDNAKSGGAGWVTVNLSDASYRISPVQGFFVRAKVGGGTTQPFSFTKAMRTHTKAGNFYKSSQNRFEIDLSVAIENLKTNTAIRYIDNTSTSFDNGYDSSMFGGYGSALEIYTGLVDGSSGKKLAIQSLPNSNYESMIIPVGVTAAAGKELTFTAEALNIPSGINVYLEDRLLNSMTRLDEANAAYKVTTSEALNGTGRFFLHTKSSGVLSTEDLALQGVSIYKSSNESLKVVGLSQGTANIKLFSILGKQVMSSKFQSTGSNEIGLPKLAKGVYVVQLETAAGNLNKKIILE